MASWITSENAARGIGPGLLLVGGVLATFPATIVSQVSFDVAMVLGKGLIVLAILLLAHALLPALPMVQAGTALRRLLPAATPVGPSQRLVIRIRSRR